MSTYATPPPRLPDASEPVLVHATTAATVVGTRERTIQARVQPDAWVQYGDQIQPLYLLANIMALAKPGGILHPSRIRGGRPRVGEEVRPERGPNRISVRSGGAE